MAQGKPYTRQPDGFRLDYRGINVYLPMDQLPEGKYPLAINVRRYLEKQVRARARQTDAIFTVDSSVHTIRRLNDSTPAGPGAGFVLIVGAGTRLFAGATPVDSGLSGNPVSMVPFRPNQSVQPWMYVADSLKMDKIRSDGLRYKMGIKEPQSAPSVSANLGSSVVISGNVTVTFWGDSPHSGPVGAYIWKNPADTGGWGPARTVADSKGMTTGNSLSFDATPAGPTTAVQWGTFSGGALTGTKDLFQPKLESEGFQDFNVTIVASLFIPAAGTHTFSITYKDNVLWGIGGGATWAGSGTLTGGAAQTMTVISKLPLLPAPLIGGGGGVTGSQSIVVTFPAAGLYPIEIDWDYWFHSGRTLVVKIDGADTPPIAGNVTLGSQYRYRFRSSATGAVSNPSPETVAASLPSQSTVITPEFSTDPQADKVDFYRLDQGLLNFTYVGTGPNTSTPTAFTDTLLDAAVAANPLLEFDNFEPFPSIDLPRSGVLTVSSGVATWVSGDLFNVRWLPGTIIVIGTVAYTLNKRPASTTSLTADNLVDGVNLPFAIAEPDLAAQPMPAMWGPTDNVAFMFACGDILRPGTLYWTKGNNPDSAPDTNQQDITSPSEPLMNGCIIGGIGMVMSTERGFLIYPNFFNALATATGTVGSTWTIQESIANRGLYIRNCIATDGGGSVFFRGKDGVYHSQGGAGSESITDADLYPIFPHEGTVTQSPVIRGGFTFFPPDDTQPTRQRFSCADGFLYYDYVDTSNVPHTLVYDIKAKGWVFDTYQFPVTIHALEEGEKVNKTIVGCANGSVRELSTGGTEVATAVLLTQSVNSGDARGNKRIGDIYIRAELDSGLSVAVQPFTGRFHNAVLGYSPTALAGTGNSTGYIIDFADGGGLEADDIGLVLSWSL